MKKLYFLLLLVCPLIGFGQPQIINSPNDLTVECDGNGNITDLSNWLNSYGGANATTTCGTIIWTNDFSALADNCGATGAATVTFTATDNCGFATAVATFSVQDTTSPNFINTASNVTVICDGSGSTAEFNAWQDSVDGAIAEDSCSNNLTISVSNSGTPPSTNCNVTTVFYRTYTATDDCGNTGTSTRSFTVEAVMSECPTTPIVLSSQAEVDAFAVIYTGCTEIPSGLTISGADITDLSPLSGITAIIGFLEIENNPLLTNLDGLNSISYLEILEGFTINNNASLIDISALSNITAAPLFNYFVVKVSNNPVLSNLNGLQNLQNDYVTRIENNDSLMNLEGLNITVEEIYIIDNDLLMNFDGLSGTVPSEIYIENNLGLNDVSAIETLEFDPLRYPLLSIRNNPNLSICNIIPFCTSISSYYEENVSNSNYVIENNASGCNSMLEVAYTCNLIPPNDDCDGAIDVTIGETIEAYNDLASASTQVPSCNDTNRIDVWFTFNSGDLSLLDITVDADFSFQLWEGTCGALTQVANACASDTLRDITVVPDTDYYLQVWSDGTGRRATGIFNVLVADATLGVAENSFEGFSVYPNPVTDLLNLKSVHTIESVEVYNLLGQSVMSSQPKALETTLEMSSYRSGVYILKVMIGNRVETFKVVKD